MAQTGEMAVLDRTGDTKTTWDRNNADEVSFARKQFDDFKKKGFAAFSVTKKGDKDEQISDFDPAAERIIFVPQIKGGALGYD